MLKTTINAIKSWVEKNFVRKNDIPEFPDISEIQVQSDWNENDENSPAYVKNKPISLLSDDKDVIDSIMSAGLFSDILAENGVIYTDDNGKVMVI